jgi:hypothetical protein
VAKERRSHRGGVVHKIKSAPAKVRKKLCSICGKAMREQYSSPKYLCKCGHAEGFIYPYEPERLLTVK